MIGDSLLAARARVSASSLLTRSTTLKKRPRAPRRMQARAMAMAAWLLPVPVPPGFEHEDVALLLDEAAAGEVPHQCLVHRSGPRSRSRWTMSLASGSLAIVIWYMIERARFSLISAPRRSPTTFWGSCCRFRGNGDDLVVCSAHAEEL